MDKPIEGFTLIETMVVLMVMGIILGLGMPSFLDLVEKMSTESEAKVFIDGLRTARLIAIEEGQNVVACPSSDGSNCGNDWDRGFLVYRDDNDDHTLNGTDEILFAHAFRESVLVRTGSEQNQRFFLDKNGWATGSADSMLICAKADSNKNGFHVVINRAGRIRVEDSTVIWKNASGETLNC